MDLEQLVEREIAAMMVHQRAVEQQIEQEISPIINEYAAKFDGSIELQREYCIKLIQTRRVGTFHEPYGRTCLICGAHTNYVIRTHGWMFPCCEPSFDRVLGEAEARVSPENSG